MKRLFLFSISIFVATMVVAQVPQTNTPVPQNAALPQQREQKVSPESSEWYYPVPPKIQPGIGTKPPSDAIILFDGTDLSKWASKDGEPAKWAIQNGELIIEPGTGSLITKEYFGDCQLHIEFKSPVPEQNTGQNRGNSGIMLQSKYEIQVLDCDNNPTYVNGMVGSVYKQSAPLVNAYTKNGEWQVYDICWKAPKFGTNDELESPAIVTVVLNGIVVQNNYVLKGTTPYTGFPKYAAHGRMPLSLQDHGTKTAFRNIWIRNL